MNTIKTYSTLLANEIKANPDFTAALQNNPDGTLAGFEQNVTDVIPDTPVYRIVVLALGITVVSIAIGVLVLMATKESVNDASIPTILTALGSAAVGALAGLLAPSPRQ